MLRHAAAAAETDRPPLLSSAPDRLEQMFRTHRGVVWRLLRCRGLSPDVAADATQEVFLVAAQRLPDIEPGKERAFLIGTAIHVARAAWRTRSRRELEDDLEIMDDRGMAIEDQRSALDLIGKLLAHIDPTLLEVFVLFEIVEFSALEISDLLGVPPGTVASRVRRAREAFRDAARRLELTLRREQGQP